VKCAFLHSGNLALLSPGTISNLATDVDHSAKVCAKKASNEEMMHQCHSTKRPFCVWSRLIEARKLPNETHFWTCELPQPQSPLPRGTSARTHDSVTARGPDNQWQGPVGATPDEIHLCPSGVDCEMVPIEIRLRSYIGDVCGLQLFSLANLRALCAGPWSRPSSTSVDACLPRQMLPDPILTLFQR